MSRVKTQVDIRDSGYRPTFYKRSMDWETPLYLGLEWELEWGRRGQTEDCDDVRFQDVCNIDEILNKNRACSNPFYYKRDYSLDHGVEFVTKPLTLQYIHNKVNIKEVVDYMVTKSKFNPATNCGIHVHLSKKFFTPSDLIKLRMFFSINQRALKKYSERSGERQERWAKFETGYNVKKFLNEKKRKGDHYDNRMRNRGYACTFGSNIKDKTIEIRLFASTTKHKRLVSILQFCDAVSHFMKAVGLGAVAKEECWKTFTDWCEQTNRYGHLIDDFEKKGLLW